MRKLLLLIPTILLVACNLRLFPPRFFTSAETDTPSSRPCSFNWASQPLTDLSARVQAAMQAAGLTGIHSRAEAYGENCYDSQTGRVVSFRAMETDFHVTAQVNDLANHEQMGNLLERILIVLDDFPAGSIPGPNSGYVEFIFQSSDNQIRLWFPVKDGVAARKQGLHGAALLEKLQK